MRSRVQPICLDESLSLRSFRVNAPPAPPSLKASSLKLTRPPSFSRILPRSNRRVQEPTIQDLISHTSNEDILTLHTEMGLPHILAGVPKPLKNNPNNAQSDQTTRSKPRSIIRMLTTKLNSRSPAGRLPPSGPNAFNKENREAALRERGLLPPLKPNKDLSAQEKEQDRAIPIVFPSSDPDSPTNSVALSAADLIKKEWEAKNRSLESAQRQRMNSFKFGGSSSVPASPGVPKEFSSESADDPELGTPVLPPPNPLLSLPVLAVPQALDSHPSPLPVPAVHPTTVPKSRPVTPLLDIPPEIAAYLFPLPPSPRSVFSTKFDSSSRPSSPSLVPLPPSPSLRGIPSLRNSSGACTPKPLDIQEPLTPISIPPIISLTPCAAVFPDSVSVDDASHSPLHKQMDLSAPLDESSSVQTPSLDSTSHTTTDSALGTSESIAISGKGRLGGLKIKTHVPDNIPVIVESPIEESFLEEQDVVRVIPTFDANLTGAATAPLSSNETESSLGTPRRVLTDPTNSRNISRKKSIIMNPFKRAGSAYADNSMNPSNEPQRRLSVKASLSNMRRSVVGTLSRKSTVGGNSGGGKLFDASHLPPSPILPLSFNGPYSPTSPSFRTGGGESSKVRRAVSPVLYSRGHILMEASNIEDEESRRVTEMAFLT